MLKFNQYLIEAKVSSANFEKAVELFKRLVEKKLSTKLYRFGGPVGYCSIKKGFGILFFYDKKKAIRFNYIKGEIQSITLWNSYKLGKSGDKTIDLGGIGLLQSAYKVLDILQRGTKTGKIPIYPDDTNLKEEVLTEAKRIAPMEFMKLVQENLPPSENITRLSFAVISDIALANDFQIPSIVRQKCKVPGTKGKNTKYDLTKLNGMEGKSAAEKKTEPVYYMKITAQDPNSKKFLSVKGDKKAEQILKTAASAINNPDVKAEMKNPDSLFGVMRNLTQVVARGARNSLIIYGGPGTGKTFTVKSTLADEGMKKDKDWFLIKGKTTTTALYKMLFMHREGSLLVFDDTDSVWGDQDAANILKAALDSYDDRTISWYSNRTVNISKMDPVEREDFFTGIDDKLLNDPTDNVKLPSEFPYNGRIIFISNLPYEKFDSAVLTRSAKIDMTLTDEQMFMRMESVLEHLGDKSVDLSAKREILDFIKTQNIKGILKAPSMRTFVAAEDLYRSGLPNWKELLDYI